jgi:hypothetical protein
VSKQADCPGHYATTCPALGVQVYDAPRGLDCGPSALG